VCEKRAVGAYRTEFFATYDYRPIREANTRLQPKRVTDTQRIGHTAGQQKSRKTSHKRELARALTPLR